MQRGRGDGQAQQHAQQQAQDGGLAVHHAPARPLSQHVKTALTERHLHQRRQPQQHCMPACLSKQQCLGKPSYQEPHHLKQ